MTSKYLVWKRQPRLRSGVAIRGYTARWDKHLMNPRILTPEANHEGKEVVEWLVQTNSINCNPGHDATHNDIFHLEVKVSTPNEKAVFPVLLLGGVMHSEYPRGASSYPVPVNVEVEELLLTVWILDGAAADAFEEEWTCV